VIGNNRTKVFSDGSPARGRLGQQEAEPSRSYPALARPLPGGERVPPLGAEQEDADTTHERYGILPSIYIHRIRIRLSAFIYFLDTVYQEDMVVHSNVKRKKNEESCSFAYQRDSGVR
jgi:hypothetical protein